MCIKSCNLYSAFHSCRVFCGVLCVLGLPAPVMTSADQGTLLSSALQKEEFPGRDAGEQDIKPGNGEATATKWFLSGQSFSNPLNLEDKLVLVSLAHQSLWKPRRNVLLQSFPDTSLLQRNLIWWDNSKRRANCFTLFPSSSQCLLSLWRTW